ncbi:amidohydrolase family protein [Xylanivirga thermophila]|uniref:amidohydrolase family protein n=1 Tax=Xylanivirga thermophila TaxID=2496273 RepID=UPI00101D906C|nr:amidohydrolase family protein [Xylanivirga thermophila]
MKHIIDIHTHAFPKNIEPKAVNFLRKYYGLEIPCSATMDSLIKSAKQGNVDKIVVCSTATSAHQVEDINNFISYNTDDRLIGFGTIHPDYLDFENEIKRIQHLGLKGIKLHPDFQKFYIDDPKMFPIYEAIGDKLPILMHTGDPNVDYSSPKRLSKVLDLFPKLRIIAAHMGGYCRWSEAEEYLIGKELFIDTSSTLFKLSPKQVTDIIRKHGTHKVLFGTDYPVSSHKEELDRFFHLPLTTKEQEAILWENASELLDLKME